MVIVGYNDADQAWVVKNNWGTGFGEDSYNATGQKGWMRVKYETSGIQNEEGYFASEIAMPPCSCTDADKDGFFPTSCSDSNCTNRTDCDDGKASVNPGQKEECTDGVDNDCDGRIDAQDPDCAANPGGTTGGSSGGSTGGGSSGTTGGSSSGGTGGSGSGGTGGGGSGTSTGTDGGSEAKTGSCSSTGTVPLVGFLWLLLAWGARRLRGR